MKIKNNKGHWCLLPLLAKGASAWPLTQSIAVGIAGVLIATCVWHIPAWEAAKDNHTEAAYQATIMFPASQKPTNGYVAPLTPTGGYWEEKLNPDVITPKH